MTEQQEQAPAIRDDVRFVGELTALGELFDALAKAQGEFQPIVKDSTAKVQMKSGGSYNFDYAGLDVVIAATQPALSKHGLALIQLISNDEVVTVLGKGAARIECRVALAQWGTYQEYGSAITYVKRYARLSMLGVFPQGADDDGAAASGHTAQITPRDKPPQVKSPVAGAITPETRDRVWKLAQKAGFTKDDLDAFSKKQGLGALGGLSELNALTLIDRLQSLEVPQ